MTPEESEIICKFAGGDKTLREKAIEIYRSRLIKGLARSTTEMGFMSEIDNIVPDLGLRYSYRRILLERGE